MGDRQVSLLTYLLVFNRTTTTTTKTTTNVSPCKGQHSPSHWVVWMWGQFWVALTKASFLQCARSFLPQRVFNIMELYPVMPAVWPWPNVRSQRYWKGGKWTLCFLWSLNFSGVETWHMGLLHTRTQLPHIKLLLSKKSKQQSGHS